MRSCSSYPAACGRHLLLLVLLPLACLGTDHLSAQVPAIASLRALSVPRPGEEQMVGVMGYAAPGDGGGGTFIYSAASVATDNGGSVILPAQGEGRWLLVVNGALNVRQFGAKGDGVTDDTAAIQAAVDSAPTGSEVYFPPGKYRLTSINLARGVTLSGVGYQVKGYPGFGESWSEIVSGSVLLSSATSGAALKWSGSAVMAVSLQNLAVVGPGRGSSTGYSSGNVQHAVTNGGINNVLFANFATGVEITNTYEMYAVRLVVAGCNVGLHVFTNSNQNTFCQTNVENCTTHGILLENATLNTFLAGAIQGCSGTAFEIRGGYQNMVEGFYWENATAAVGLTISTTGYTGSDKNLIVNPHFGTPHDTVLIQGRNNQVINPAYTAAPWTISGSSTFVLGTISALVTDTGTGNMIFSPYTNTFYAGNGAAGLNITGNSTEHGQAFLGLSLPNQPGAPRFTLKNAEGIFVIRDDKLGYAPVSITPAGAVRITAGGSGQSITLAPSNGGETRIKEPVAVTAANGGSSFRSTGAGDTAQIVFVNDRGAVGRITTSGQATAYNTVSDARLKTNLRDVSDSGQLIDALHPRLFDWRQGGRNVYGFVAQETYPVFPQAVTKGDDNSAAVGEPWAMDATKMIPVIVAEEQALRQRIARLEAEVAALTAKSAQPPAKP